MKLTAPTANFGCASPGAVGVQARRRQAAFGHARQLRSDGIDLVLAQEIPGDDWVEEWRSSGYDVFLGPKSYSVRSAVVARRDLGAEPFELVTSAYHGTYLAAARISLGGTPVVMVSVHASPTALTTEYLNAWKETGVPAGQRVGEPGRSQWWDSDHVLGTLVHLAQDHQVLAAGDFNECRAWDARHGGTWGQEYFAHIGEAGLGSVTWEQWGSERQTYLGSEDGFQLDHVLATADVLPLIGDAQVVPGDLELVATGEEPDHARIAFTVRAA